MLVVLPFGVIVLQRHDVMGRFPLIFGNTAAAQSSEGSNERWQCRDAANAAALPIG